jgi:hypothetical protein
MSERMALSSSWRALRPDVLAVAAVVNWGLSYGLTKLALAQWRPLAFTGTRFLAMALIAATVLGSQGRWRALVGPDRYRFLLGGLLGFTLHGRHRVRGPSLRGDDPGQRLSGRASTSAPAP